MTISELKKYILQNEKVQFILESIGCKNIVLHGEKNGSNRDYYTCSNPDGDNPVAITVFLNDYINIKDYTRDEIPDGADIFELIKYALKIQHKRCDFCGAIQYVHEILGLSMSFYSSDKETERYKKDNDPLYWFNKIKARRISCVANEIEIPELQNYEEYENYPHISFVHEGIMPKTWKKFGLGYSYTRKRTIIPLRYWLTGEIIGYNMRTSRNDYKELGIRKYFITPGYPKSMNLYGLWENGDDIQKNKYVVVYEAEKSVLIRDSLGDSTGVAVQGHSISSEQTKILIGLGVNIIIAFDKDVSLEQIRSCCEKFYHVRNVYYLYDEDGYLGEKDSPVDCGDYVFQKLMDKKIKYNDEEHIKYLESVNRIKRKDI